MPYAKQLRELLEQIAANDDPLVRRELINRFGAALENRFTQINSRNAAVIGQVENDLKDMITALRHELLDEIHNNRALSAAKTHQLSNFIMALENKIDELAQLVMLQNPYDYDTDDDANDVGSHEKAT